MSRITYWCSKVVIRRRHLRHFPNVCQPALRPVRLIVFLSNETLPIPSTTDCLCVRKRTARERERVQFQVETDREASQSNLTFSDCVWWWPIKDSLLLFVCIYISLYYSLFAIIIVWCCGTRRARDSPLWRQQQQQQPQWSCECICAGVCGWGVGVYLVESHRSETESWEIHQQRTIPFDFIAIHRRGIRDLIVCWPRRVRATYSTSAHGLWCR